jgi:hypothetical protein
LPFFFHVLVVYSHRNFMMFRAYSLDTGRRSAEATRSHGPKIDEPRLRMLGQDVVQHGMAYWSLWWSALVVRLDVEPREVTTLTDGIMVEDDDERCLRLMSVTTQDPDSKEKQMCFIEAGFRSDIVLRKVGLPFRSIILIPIVLVHRNLYVLKVHLGPLVGFG